LLESIQGLSVVFLVGKDDSEQIVSFDIGGLAQELLVDDIFRLIQLASLNQLLCVEKRGIRECYRSMILVRWRLLRVAERREERSEQNGNAKVVLATAP
jgi:hypothetical protein